MNINQWDHPRLRGEHTQCYFNAQHCVGSPPPTRGTLFFFMPIQLKFRITPAYAGNTILGEILCRQVRDHPRLRGEHVARQDSLIKETGITPAYAGNTAIINIHIIVFQDHPRLRGEHLDFFRYVIKHIGSPPPTRGTLIITVYIQRQARITPAYAGNTLLNLPMNLIVWDHPRLRGEHTILTKQEQLKMGSPPPTRGTQ